MYKFIRIINGEEYEDFLREEGVYKYIPKRLLHTFQKNIKPRIIGRYMSKDSEEEIGLVVGILLNQDNISKNEYKDKIIETINNLKEQEEYIEIEFLLLDNFEIDIDDLEEIKELCNIKIPEGKDVFAENVLSCLENICKAKDEILSEKEVFILSDDTKVTEDLVNELALSTKFISIYIKDEDFGMRLEKDVLNRAGLALHVRKDTVDSFEDFDFIINLSEHAKINVSNLKRNKIAIDLSANKCLSCKRSKALNKAIVIDDLFFENDNSIYSENGKYEFDKYLNTAIHKLFCNNNKDIGKVQINNKIFSIEQVVELGKFKKHSESGFNKT